MATMEVEQRLVQIANEVLEAIVDRYEYSPKDPLFMHVMMEALMEVYEEALHDGRAAGRLEGLYVRE